jgi:hypothetical protein
MAMSRERLTDKTASEVVNDVYLNESRTEGNKNVPEANGTPDSWNETPVSKEETAKLNKEDVDNRDESNIAAIKNAAELEERAVKCLVASQRMLPSASRETLEANALDLMNMPTASIDGLLSRQEDLARSIAASAQKIAEDCEEEEEEKAAGEEVIEVAEEAEEAPAKEEVNASAELFAKLAASVEALSTKVEKLAADKEEEEEEEKKEEKTASEVKTASTSDSLDDIFQAVAPSADKAGANSMQGMVRKASDMSDEQLLSGLWDD